MGDRLYICFTYYHVLISIIKEINSREKSDIIICNTIPKYNELIETLKQKKYFRNIYLFEEKTEEPWLNTNISEKLKIFLMKFYARKIKIPFALKKNNFKDIYIYNDWTRMGYYLRANGIYYNLLEDAKDAFKVLDKYVQIDYNVPLIRKIFGYFLETSYVCGKSRYAKSIEVNNPNDLKVPLKKIKVNSKQEMFELLKENQKKEIYKTFVHDEEFSRFESNPNVILILTQPLFADSLVASKDAQVQVYKDIIDMYGAERMILIKPHPRDQIEYENIFSNVLVLDKTIPTEVLNFNKRLIFRRAITVSSTSLDAIDFVEEKLYLGFDWLKKYN